jgi:colanic acid/amylovoran biosynthesis glycosyltransferase
MLHRMCFNRFGHLTESMTMFRVIHSFPLWLPQTQTWMYNQIRYLPAERIDAHVVCERTENLDQFAIQNLHVLGGRRSWRFWREKMTRKLGWNYSAYLVGHGRRLDAKVVHSHFGPTAWHDMPSVRIIPARHVVTFYGYDVNRLSTTEPIWRERYIELFAHIDLVLCEGPFMASAIARLGCPPEKLRVHHLGVQVEKIGYKPRSWIPGRPLRVLIAASFTEKKGIPYALEALAGLKNKVSLEVTIVGDAKPDSSQQAEKHRILETIDRCGLSSVVRLLGFQPHARLLDEASRHHIFLSPSVTAADGDTEGGAPVTIIEMAASGVPIVSTRHCDIPSVVQDGRTGLLADERDIKGLTAQICRLIENPAQWGPMLLAARRDIELRFDARTQGLRLADIYDQVLAR